MKRAIIRGLWGVTEDFWKTKDKTFEFEKKFDYDKTNGCAQRRYKLNDPIQNTLSNFKYKRINEQTCMYVLGEANYNYIKSLNIPCRKIYDEPYMYDPVQKSWKHKLEILKAAMEDFDEIVWMDYDCILRKEKEYPEDFWERLGKRSSFQAPLVRFARIQSNLRSDPQLNKIQPNGSFVYMRDKSIPQKLLDIYDQLNAWSDEVAYAKYTDDLMGGFDIKKYWDNFETLMCNNKKSVYLSDPIMGKIKIEEAHFWHGF